MTAAFVARTVLDVVGISRAVLHAVDNLAPGKDIPEGIALHDSPIRHMDIAGGELRLIGLQQIHLAFKV